MANKGIMNNIKNEIDTRKKEKNMVSSSLGESVGSDVAPRDVFLHGLKKSLKTGAETASSSLIKTVVNKAAKHKGETANLPVNPVAPAPINETVAPVQMSPERDEQMYADMRNMGNKTLAESIQGFSGANPAATNTAPVVNYGGNQYLTSAPAGVPVAGGQINEGVLVESVKQIVNGHLVESLSPILEEAIKSTVLEMYAIEQVRKVITDNPEIINEAVYRTIRELKKKKQ